MSTTLPILNGMVQRGLVKDFKLETIEDEPGSGSREHDRLTLVFPNGEQLVIDTVCSGSAENVSIYIDNASAPEDRSTECECPCHTGNAKHIMPCGCYSGNPVKR